MEHYFSENPECELKISEIESSFNGQKFKFLTSSGVFSKAQIDKGTELLIKSAVVKNGWKILDLGCGYGPAGIIIKKLFPKCDVFMTDINKRAIYLSKKNAAINKVKINVLQGDVFEPLKNEKDFDAILLNPPQTAGRELCYEMIIKSSVFLKKNGVLHVVARHNKGGKMLMKHMESVFGNVTTIAKSKGFHVYLSEKQ